MGWILILRVWAQWEVRNSSHQALISRMKAHLPMQLTQTEYLMGLKIKDESIINNG